MKSFPITTLALLFVALVSKSGVDADSCCDTGSGGWFASIEEAPWSTARCR